MRPTASAAPIGAPTAKAINVAVRLTRSDRATIPKSSGSRPPMSDAAMKKAWPRSFTPAASLAQFARPAQRPRLSVNVLAVSAGRLRRDPAHDVLDRHRPSLLEDERALDPVPLLEG